TEALQIAVALTDSSYNNFAADFGAGAMGITESAQKIQLESLETKMARLSLPIPDYVTARLSCLRRYSSWSRHGTPTRWLTAP
ncbi:MAG: hypothetical protein LBG73_08720, partial [Spirochaetaceae bacterium]|nr:hypothetical protein [Spirochaetaceae bacterium]